MVLTSLFGFSCYVLVIVSVVCHTLAMNCQFWNCSSYHSVHTKKLQVQFCREFWSKAHRRVTSANLWFEEFLMVTEALRPYFYKESSKVISDCM